MKKFLAALFVLCLFIGMANDAEAQKSFSSGRSSSSAGRSSSSSSRSSGSSIGRSSSSSSSRSSPSSPSFSRSSGSSSKPAISSSPKPSSSFGGSSFFSSSKSSGGPKNDVTSHAQKVESTKVYTQPKTPADHIRQETAKSYAKKSSPASSPSTSTVTTAPTRTFVERSSTFYKPYYGSGSPVVYHHYNDYWNPFLMGWLISDSLNSSRRAEWVYHHRDSIDEERYRELVKKDAALEAKLKEMEANGVPKDPKYVPDEFKDNPDLMYDKQFVEPDADNSSSATATNTESSGTGIGTVFLIIGGIFLAFFVVAIVLGNM